MFKTAKDTITLPVHAEVLLDGGKKTRVNFRATYKIIKSHSDKQAILAEIESEEQDDETIINEYLVGWEGLRGDDNENIEFSSDTLAEALDLTEYRRALVNGFVRAQFNTGGEREKN